MAEHHDRMANLPSNTEVIDNARVRKSVRTGSEKFFDTLKSPTYVQSFLLGSAACIVALPSGWMALVPLSLCYYTWATSRRYRLQFRGPVSWKGPDYSDPHPAKKGEYSDTSGILYLGLDQGSGEELWVTNSDARRHGFVLGTTGSGKALPDDALVLTRRGFVMNRDIRPGDILVHADGGETVVESVHPQGERQVIVVWLDDGRFVECSPDHLWTVDVRGMGATPSQEGRRTMETRDLGIMVEGYGASIDVRLPLPAPVDLTEGSALLTETHAVRAADMGFANAGVLASGCGTAAERRRFLAHWFRHADCRLERVRGADGRPEWRLRGLSTDDAQEVKRIVRSLGGRAVTYVPARNSGVFGRLARRFGPPRRKTGRRLDVAVNLPGMKEIFGVDPVALLEAPRIVRVEATDRRVPMTCVKTSRPDGLYIVEDFVVTHNTELLLGLITQSMMWSSGFLFIDGKGTAEFYTRIWALARRFGREDDVRVLNFTGEGGDPDAPPGGPGVQSNTSNPFAKGDSDQLMNILVSIMGDAGKGNDMWKDRATTLVTASMKAMVEMRNRGDIIFNVQVLREFLALGKGVEESLLGRKEMKSISDIPAEAWEEMRARAGMIEIYLRALNGEFSSATLVALKGFFDSLPGFDEKAALNGKTQSGKCNEQFNFLYMQLTKPLSTFADSYRHIFMTPFGEVDMADVMLNRRILVVLLPALQKAKAEMQNCGKVIVSLIKIMMGNASGSSLEGDKRQVNDASPTKSVSPFIVVLDEVGYYMVDGIDVMMAQARSLSFMVILAGQDMAAMQAVSKEISEITMANASVFAAGKCVDGGRTLEAIQKVFGKVKVAVWSGFEVMPGMMGSSRVVNRKEISFEEVDRVSLRELQALQPGEFYYLFDGALAKSFSFFIGTEKPDRYEINKFVLIRGPMDTVPNLDQSEELRFMGGYSGCAHRLLALVDGRPLLDPPKDMLDLGLRVAEEIRARAGKKAGQIGLKAEAAAILTCYEADFGSADTMDYDDLEEVDGTEVIGEVEDIRPGESIRKVNSTSAPERHQGMIDILMAQNAARIQAEKMKRLSPATEEEQREESLKISEFFERISRNREAFERLLLDDDMDAKMGADLIRQSVTSRPIVGEIQKRGREAMGALERMGEG